MESPGISERRIAADIERIAEWNESVPEVGFHRPTFSPSWKSARDYVADEARKAGAKVRTDPAGNLRARPPSLGWDQKAWICGSHLDSVPTGGRYDGVVGVVVALELLRSRPDLPVELVVFAEEEGTGFGVALLGSRAWAGTIGSDELLNLTNRQGESFADAGRPFGVDPDALRGSQGFSFQGYLGMVEVHIEQGASLWNRNEPVAVVTAVNGRRQYSGSLTGEANHAGSTAMTDRRDALTGAAELALALETLGRELAAQCGSATVTMGSLEVTPGAANVVPGSAAFTIDFRANTDAVLEEGDARIRGLFADIGTRRNLQTTLTCYENLGARPLDHHLCGRLQRAAEALGGRIPEVSSGALHDAAVMAGRLPAAMVFVASRGGISHNPAEFSRTADIAQAARIIAAAFEGAQP